MSKNIRAILLKAYNLLYNRYGPRKWWPADSDFEVMIGAILTQNTSWSNVEKAISNLKKEGLLNPSALSKLHVKKIAKLIHPCGYYNIKAERLQCFLKFLSSNYSNRISRMRKERLRALRKELLSVKGIGPETADSIILYAVKKPIFVIDAYTKRIMSCLGICELDSDYCDMQDIFMSNLPKSVKLFNEYHALLVEHAKTICKAKPKCSECVLRTLRKEK